MSAPDRLGLVRPSRRQRRAKLGNELVGGCRGWRRELGEERIDLGDRPPREIEELYLPKTGQQPPQHEQQNLLIRPPSDPVRLTAILADLLGFDQSTAEDWTQLANTDWVRYAAAR